MTPEEEEIVRLRSHIEVYVRNVRELTDMFRDTIERAQAERDRRSAEVWKLHVRIRSLEDDVRRLEGECARLRAQAS